MPKVKVYVIPFALIVSALKVSSRLTIPYSYHVTFDLHTVLHNIYVWFTSIPNFKGKSIVFHYCHQARGSYRFHAVTFLFYSVQKLRSFINIALFRRPVTVFKYINTSVTLTSQVNVSCHLVICSMKWKHEVICGLNGIVIWYSSIFL